MRIVNKTNFSTRSLRSIFCAALQADEHSEGPLPSWQRKNLTVTVTHTRRSRFAHISGRATLGGVRMRLRLALPPGPDLTQLVWLFLHELQHIRGAEHRQMSDKVLQDMAVEVVTRRPDLRLVVKAPPTPRPRPPLRLVRYEHAKAMLAEKKAALARMLKQAKKWERRVKYYEKALREAAVQAETSGGVEEGETNVGCPSST